MLLLCQASSCPRLALFQAASCHMLPLCQASICPLLPLCQSTTCPMLPLCSESSTCMLPMYQTSSCPIPPLCYSWHQPVQGVIATFVSSINLLHVTSLSRFIVFMSCTSCLIMSPYQRSSCPMFYCIMSPCHVSKIYMCHSEAVPCYYCVLL